MTRSRSLRTLAVVLFLVTLGSLANVVDFAVAADYSYCHQSSLLLSESSLDEDSENSNMGEKEMAHRIMYNQQCRKRESIHYQIVAAEAADGLARRMEETHPDRFTYHRTKWKKFPDGTDQIEIGGFHPNNLISGEHVLFLASFHNNDVTLSQFQVMIALLQSFIASLTIVLPFSPVGTMERIIREGQVATAATYAHMFSSLPNCGRPTRLMVYDLHTLQNRFYLHGNAVASLHTAIPLLKRKMKESNINGVAFPDDGAAKRFGAFFDDMDVQVIVCGKTRGEGDTRTVVIQDGDATNLNIVIVDDLVQTGGTLYETGKVLKEAGAASVNAFVSHAVFPNNSWKRFNKGGDRACFDKFWVTNSIPTVTDSLPVQDGVFEVLDLMDLIITDLDHFKSNCKVDVR
jgi:ribose-phosphate pyrophosphokinase